ncbi:AAA family ATPase [Candidatus Haliotispira prima]|uniref:AAA family ATPase n=1 Tax=Candidatus Haliotispira prima TaxID=3034016 RepID=A0ABY8MKE9_9SPIO|nr:AAA family ATPase [Candidatus Haliotispira prima]
MELTRFRIKKLYGRQDCTLKFSDNRLILVGENGAGKTTVLRILFLVLSCQWSGLSKYAFDSVSITLGGKSLTISKSDISKQAPFSDKRFLKRLPLPVRDHVRMMLSREGDIDINELEFICEQYGVSARVVMRELHSQSGLFGGAGIKPEVEEKLGDLKSHIEKNQILYLPTYRRIEQELSYIFTDFDTDEFRRNQRRRMLPFHGSDKQVYTELVEFGMNDVKEAIDRKLEYLKEFTRNKLNSLTLAYLGDVVDKKYDKVDVKEIKAVEEETVRNILERIDPKILAKSSKEHLVDTIQNVKNDAKIDEHQKVICHYFSKLLSFHQELEREEQGILRFCEVCNNYMGDKYLKYTSSSFDFKVAGKKHDDAIELSQLSSGEKQIVSLFSHLYLSGDITFFVMIDEPELSLSVPWQSKFLQDISQSDLCSGFLAVTHSPFIYENDLEKYAHSLGEFIKDVN